jgi:hypothetical protein
MSRTEDRIAKTNNSRSASEALLLRRIRTASVGATVAGIAVVGSLTLTSHQEASAATPLMVSVVPVSVGLSVGSDDPPPPANPGDMPQDMPGMDMSGSSPAPTDVPAMPQDMPGMDMGGSSPAPKAPAQMSPDMPGMDMSGSSSGAAVHRPLAPVLGTFGGGTAAVLLAAGMMRRKDLDLSLAKKAARIAGGAKK